MKKALKEYGYFMRALKKCIGDWGSQNRAAIDAEISDTYMSQIINGKKRASFDAQVAIAKAFKYEYVDFLKSGISLKERRAKKNKLSRDPEIIKILDKVEIILKSKNLFIINHFKQCIDFLIEDIEKSDPEKSNKQKKKQNF